MSAMIPRPEYPRPQMVRESFLNLNGLWEFEIDNGRTGASRGLTTAKSLAGTINVPFCPESLLSGVGHRDFMAAVWYRRALRIPEEMRGKRILLHFGAVDYASTVYINGKPVKTHKGGYTPFFADITDDLLYDGTDFVTLCAEDDLRSGKQPSGKQSSRYESYGCSYTRTTGIWQTVWMEAVDKAHAENIRYTAEITEPSVTAAVKVSTASIGGTLTVKTCYEGKPTGEKSVMITDNEPTVCIPLSEKHLWEAGNGRLYDTVVTIEKDGVVTDSVKGYFGLRSVSLADGAFTLNGRKLFGRWVLDQGFYPDGVYTAPTDEALKNDIVYSMQLGFNGARLHQKIFEPRFLYWADKLGYLVWGEHANWGLAISEPASLLDFLPEWIEALERDFSHPAIIGWCPFNETWNTVRGQQCDDVLRAVYEATKAFDKTRPVIDTSGNYHVVTDIFDVHDYEQDPEAFASYYVNAKNGEIRDQVERREPGRQKWHGEPVFMSEYGGIRKRTTEEGWGYGNAPKDDEEFLDRYRRLTDVLLDNDAFIGFCYTQLYDVEQEQNGLLTYDRRFKFDPAIFHTINTRRAAIED